MSKVNGNYSIGAAQWQQIQKLESNQGNLSGLSELEKEEVKELEKKGSTETQKELQSLLALLQKNEGSGQQTASQGLGISHYA